MSPRTAPVFDTKEDDAMPRPRRSFETATSYHVTMRCNNQAFDLRRPQARKVILFCLARAKERFGFDLFGLCVMSNHVHYLIRPARPEEMPKLMHWLNWYSAMLLNRLLRRRGHFWERRYHAVAVPDRDSGHALRVLRYIDEQQDGKRRELLESFVSLSQTPTRAASVCSQLAQESQIRLHWLQLFLCDALKTQAGCGHHQLAMPDLAALSEQLAEDDERGQDILGALYDYAEQIAP